MWSVLLIAACASAPTYIVDGTVVAVEGDRVLLDHKRIEGFMGPMVMAFDVADPGMLGGLEPGHRVLGRLSVRGMEVRLEKLRVTGKGPPPPMRTDGPPVLQPGQVLPSVEVEFEDGSSGTIGAGQGRPTAVGFLYTRCPDPTFCADTVARMQALQPALPDNARIVAVTLDPEIDTAPALSAFALNVEADPQRWRFARVSEEATTALAMRAGMPVARAAHGEIVHGLRLWVLDEAGRLVARHDDNRWTVEQVADQLGGQAPGNASGEIP